MRVVFTHALLILLALPATGETLQELQARATRTSDLAAQRAAQCDSLISNHADQAEIDTCIRGMNNLIQRADNLLIVLEQKTTEYERALYSWRLRDEGLSLIDDSPTLTLIKYSRQKNTCRHGDGRSFILFRCIEGETQIYFDLNGCMYDPKIEQAVLRIGSGPAETVEITGDRDIFVIKDYSLSVGLINRMLTINRVVFRTETALDQRQTIAFNIAGLKTAITPLREACHW